MKKEGKFIVIEGPDGTGKSTQTDLLANKLVKEGYQVKKFDFPQYKDTFFGAMVGRFLNGDFGELSQVDPHLASVLFAGDRWQASKKIRKLKSEGSIILANRYRFSNIAHQAAKIPKDKREQFIEFLDELELEVFKIPKEDINIILHVNPEKARELIERKNERDYLKGKKMDIHEANIDYQIEVASIYRDLPKTYPHIVGINCENKNGLMLPKEIHKLVWVEISKRIGSRREGQVFRERQ